jgi:hypothetical protein
MSGVADDGPPAEAPARPTSKEHTAAAKLFVDRSDARKEFLPDPGPRLS